MGVGETFGEAMLKSQLGAGSRLPTKGTVCISVKDGDKQRAVAVARDLVALGFSVVATKGTAAAISASGVPVKPVNKVKDGRPHIADAIKAGDIQLVFTTVDETRTAIADSRSIRQAALANRVTYYTTMAGCEAAVEALKHQDDLVVYAVQKCSRKSCTASSTSSVPPWSRPSPRHVLKVTCLKTPSTTQPRTGKASSRAASTKSKASSRPPRSSTRPTWTRAVAWCLVPPLRWKSKPPAMS